MTRAIEDLSLVGHACLVPESSEHLWEVTARWIALGLAAGERVLYSEDDTADALLGRLADDRVSVTDAMAEGRFVVIPTDVTRAMLAMSLDAMESNLHQIIDETGAAGWPGLCLAGESGPGLLQAYGLDKVIAYERLLSRVLGASPTTRMLCRYDRRHFNERAIAAMRAVHTTELRTPETYDDDLLRITHHGLGSVRLAGELDRSNSLPLRQVLDATLDQVLRAATTTEIVLDLSSLRFADVGAATVLVHAAEAFPSTHRLVLTGVRPRVQRILDRCGAPFAVRLDVVPHGQC